MSPIKGITDNVQPAFPRIGKLFKGAEATRDNSGKVVRIGSDLSYFRFVSDRPEVQVAFEAQYGKQPALINVYLPYADVESNFQCWKEEWTAGGLKHRCDGEVMAIWQGDDGKYYRTPKTCTGGCDEVGRLSLIVPELVEAGHVGYVVLQTHGINDLLSVQASLMAAADVRTGNHLGLRGIRWRLYRIKEKISTPGQNGKRARREQWLVKIEPAVDWVKLQLQAAHNATMMLPAPRLITDDGEIIDKPVSPDELAQELADAEPPTDDIETPEYGDYTEEGTLHDQSVFEPVTEMRRKCGREIARLGYSPTQVDGHCRKNYGGLGYADLGLDALTTFYERLEKTEKRAS